MLFDIMTPSIDLYSIFSISQILISFLTRQTPESYAFSICFFHMLLSASWISLSVFLLSIYLIIKSGHWIQQD